MGLRLKSCVGMVVFFLEAVEENPLPHFFSASRGCPPSLAHGLFPLPKQRCLTKSLPLYYSDAYFFDPLYHKKTVMLGGIGAGGEGDDRG